MSERAKNQGNPSVDPELTIKPSAEMAEALREAMATFEAREAGSSGPGASTADKLTIELLSQELQELKRFHEEKIEEFEEQKDHFLRLQAEFENFRRRSLKEKQENARFGHQNLVKDLVSAVDNLERAMEHGAQFAGVEVRGVLDGIALVHREIVAAFEKHGVSQIYAAGQLFDPAFNEAIGQIPSSEVPANSIVQVLQKGYVIHDRMVRPSRVLVSRELTPEERAVRGGD